MSAVVYSVVATLPDEATAVEYAAWLADGHVAAVLRGGAESGEIVRIREPAIPIQVESRYVFPSRAALEGYLRDHAPALRAAGLERFGARGVRFERRVGIVL